MYNKNDIPRMEAELTAAIGTPEYDILNQEYTGPGVGLVFDDKTGVLSLASEWTFDANGDIVRLDSITGPGVK